MKNICDRETCGTCMECAHNWSTDESTVLATLNYEIYNKTGHFVSNEADMSILKHEILTALMFNPEIWWTENFEYYKKGIIFKDKHEKD